VAAPTIGRHPACGDYPIVDLRRMLTMTRLKYFLGYLRSSELVCAGISELSSSYPFVLALFDILRLLDSIVVCFLERVVSAQLENSCDFFGHVGVGRFAPL
jgi:hypothetical protein